MEGKKNSETWKALKGILKPLWLRTVSEALHFNFLLILADEQENKNF